MGLLILLSHACAAPTLTSKQQSLCPKCKEPHRFVRMQISPGDSQQGSKVRFAHPFRLKSQDWVRLLNDIRVRSSSEGLFFFENKGTVTQAFTADEIQYLSAILSKAFAQVPADKWIMFGLSRVRSPQIIEVTTGGWYVEGTRIHLLLANYRLSVTMPNVLERLWLNPLLPDVPSSFGLVAGEHQKLGTTERFLNAGAFNSDIPDLAIDYKSVLTPRPVGEGAGEIKKIPPEPTTSDQSIEQRLRTLERLKKDRLITEEEYQTKRKQLIDRF